MRLAFVLCLAVSISSATGCTSQAQKERQEQEQLDKEQALMMQKTLATAAERQLNEDGGARTAVDAGGH